jgi:hypothetical protein
LPPTSAANRPFNAWDIGAIHVNDRDKAARLYKQFNGKALAVGPNWQWSMTGRADSSTEAARIVLQRCGYLTHSPCRVAAINDALVLDSNLLDAVPRSIPAKQLDLKVTGPDYSLAGPDLQIDHIPFISDQTRALIHRDLDGRSGHTAVAISLWGKSWTTWGRGSAEEARTNVLGRCLGSNQSTCIVYAVDGQVIWKEPPLDVPPAPWFNHANDRPFYTKAGVFSESVRKFIDTYYLPSTGPKAIAFWGGYIGAAQDSDLKTEDEAARLALERCGYLVQARCKIIAMKDSFVLDAETIANLAR